MLNKVKKRTTRVDHASPIADSGTTRRQVETKNRRSNQDGRTKVAPVDPSSHPLLLNRVDANGNLILDQTNTTNDSFGPTSLYAESNDSAQSEHSTSEHINFNEIDMIVQSAPLDVINEEEPEEVFIAEINLPSDSTPTKSSEPTRKSGRVAKPASFKDSVMTVVKSKSKILLKKTGVVANPQTVIDPLASKRLKGIVKKNESAQQGPEVYKKDDENQNEEDASEQSESGDTTSSSDDDDGKGSKEKKVKKDKKKDRKDRKDKKSKKDKKKRKGKDKHKKKDKKHNKSKEEEKKTRKRKVDELALPLSDPLLKQPSLNKVFAGLIGESITSERSPHTTEGSDQPKKKKRKREVENLRVSSAWRTETPAFESTDAEGILSGSLDTKDKKTKEYKRKRNTPEAEAQADSKKRKLDAPLATHDTLKKAWNVSCHYCRVSQNNKKQVSHNVFYVNCTGCQNTFCKPCIEGPIGLNFNDTIKLVNWLCQCCTRDCCCFFEAGECPRHNVAGHGHCFTYKLKVKKEQTTPKVEPVAEVIPALPSPGVGAKTLFTPVLKLKDSGSQKKKKRTDHTFVPKVSNPKAEFREGSSEEDGFERQPVNREKKEKGERKVYSKKHKVNDSDDDEFERPVKKEKGERQRTKRQKENSFEEIYKKRTKDERDADEELRNGKSLSSAYSNIAVSPSRPRARAKTKKLMQAEDDQAQRKQRSIEKKLTKEDEDDIALELVSFQDQISYYIDSIQAEIKACDLALDHLPKKERNPLEFTYISNLGNMKRNTRLYGDDESSEISDFSDSALSSWTDSLVDSFEESDFEVQIEIPTNTAIKV
jgi:hypothetical protein